VWLSDSGGVALGGVRCLPAVCLRVVCFVLKHGTSWVGGGGGGLAGGGDPGGGGGGGGLRGHVAEGSLSRVRSRGGT